MNRVDWTFSPVSNPEIDVESGNYRCPTCKQWLEWSEQHKLYCHPFDGLCLNALWPRRTLHTTDDANYTSLRPEVVVYDAPASYAAYLKGERWQIRRKQILVRDQYRCVLCFSTRDLQVHHRTYDRMYQELDSDLITLCRECHARHHGVLA